MAVGRDRATLTDDEETKILSEIPNMAVARVATMGRWKHLRQTLHLQLQPNLPRVLLPELFEQFEMGDCVAYVQNSGWARPEWCDLGTLRQWRAIQYTYDIPTHLALGGSLEELESCTATVSGSAGSFTAATGYKYRWIAIDENGRVRVSDVADSGAFTSKASVAVAGWGTDAGTVSIYRSTDGGTTFKAITAAAAIVASTTSSYADATASASLGNPLYLEPSTSATLLGRLWLELFPTPTSAEVLTGLYRRAPRTMSAESDLPDMPLALHRACLLAVRIIAREEFLQPVPPELEQALQNEINRVGPPLLNPVAQNAGGLRDLRRRDALPVGRNMDLDASWGS